MMPVLFSSSIYTWNEIKTLLRVLRRNRPSNATPASLSLLVIVRVLRIAKKGRLLCDHRLALYRAGRRAGPVQICLRAVANSVAEVDKETCENIIETLLDKKKKFSPLLNKLTEKAETVDVPMAIQMANRIQVPLSSCIIR